MKKPILLLCVLLIGGVFGWFAHALPFAGTNNVYRGSILRLDTSDYKLIDPILACETGTEDAFPEFRPIAQKIQNLVDAQKRAGEASDMSVYVRSLMAGRWFVINGTQTYAPASMLKVFVMMAYYKEAEDVPSILQKQIIFNGPANQVNDTPGEVIPHLTNGAPYTVDALVRQMIVYSDNYSMNILVNNFDKNTLKTFNGIFSDLNIPSPIDNTEGSLNFMTTSEYSLVYRVLFAGSYLSRSYSEKALKILSQAHWNNGINVGVPAGVTIAHKFGLKMVPAADSIITENELHDCGIVYYPDHPYILCIMTRGNNFALLQQDIQKISSTLYNDLDAFYKTLK